MRLPIPSLTLAMTLAAWACGGRGEPSPAADASPAASALSGGAPATSHVVDIKAISDDKGNYFEPKKVEAHRGDVLKFTLVSGVHNVHFPADKNPGASGLPDPSEPLQLPGQTLEIPVAFKPGKYFFQCDPHAALGMTGELDVED
jgi:plastocyanin